MDDATGDRTRGGGPILSAWCRVDTVLAGGLIGAATGNWMLGLGACIALGALTRAVADAAEWLADALAWDDDEDEFGLFDKGNDDD